MGQGFEDGLSDRPIDAVVVCGDEKTPSDRIEAHYLAGATRVCVHPLHPEGKSEPDWPTIEALAPEGA